ncbi:unnamed protein product [Symbiodinium microadriaticum]|nr:copA [Symbiodinium sp. KB8]CAE7178127.1 unnamed protein product [Symbiodinium microadriaticum]
MEEAGRLLSTIELDEFTIKEVQNGWETVEKRLGGAKAAGEEVFGKLKNEVPKTQGMLTRSSTVWHLTSELMQSLDEPKLVQKRLEYIALRHMNADITTADVEVFRNILFEASRLLLTSSLCTLFFVCLCVCVCCFVTQSMVTLGSKALGPVKRATPYR